MPHDPSDPSHDDIEQMVLELNGTNQLLENDQLMDYVQKLCREWNAEIRALLLEWLRNSDPIQQSIAILVISEAANEDDLEALEEVITDPTFSDIAKISLMSILQRLQSDLHGEVVLEYLNNPEAAFHLLQTRVLDMAGRSEIDLEAVLEELVSLSRDRLYSFLHWLAQSRDARAALILIPFLHHEEELIAVNSLKALEILGPVALQHTLPALRQFSQTTERLELRKRADNLLARLQASHLLEQEVSWWHETNTAALPPYGAYIGFLDGQGMMAIMLAWKSRDGLLKGVNILSQEGIGIKDCFGMEELLPEQWQKLASGETEKQETEQFPVPFSFARALILDAWSENGWALSRVPTAYAVWRALIEQSLPSDTETSEPIRLGLLPVTEEVYRLASTGGELFRRPEFRSWLFLHFPNVEKYAMQFWAACLRTIPESDHDEEVVDVDKQQELLQYLDRLTREAIIETVDEEWRRLYAHRLLRQAALCRVLGREEDAHLIQAVASVLHPKSGVAVIEQSFVWECFRATIEQAPLRLLKESLAAVNKDFLQEKQILSQEESAFFSDLLSE